MAPQLLLGFIHPLQMCSKCKSRGARIKVQETCLLDESEIYAVPVNFRAKIHVCVFGYNSQNTLIDFNVIFYSDIC